MTLSIGPCCAEACALDRSESFHRPAAGEALFRAERAENALRRVARALRRVVALGPRIHALQLRFSVSSHRHVAMCRGSPGRGPAGRNPEHRV